MISVVYITECLLKIVAYGFFLDENTYLRKSSHILEFAVVLCCVLQLVLINRPNAMIGYLQTFRVI